MGLKTKKLNKNQLGRQAETKFCSYLTHHGHTLIKRNFRYVLGEIDVISEADGKLWFWEVKFRTTDLFGWPEAAVNKAKLKRLRQGIEIFLKHHPRYQDYDYRLYIAAGVVSGSQIKWSLIEVGAE